MRALFSKLMTVSMVAGAALAVSACGGSGNNATEANTVEMNSMDSSMEGSMNDVTAVDASMGSDANMMMDNSSMAMDNSMGMNSTDMSANAMGNAM